MPSIAVPSDVVVPSGMPELSNGVVPSLLIGPSLPPSSSDVASEGPVAKTE